MNPSFEEMWNGCTTPEYYSEHEEDIFASMQPYRVPLSMSSSIDLRSAKIYRKLHAWNVCEASSSMEMISTKTICRKCLMHTKVCRSYGHTLKKYEVEQQKQSQSKCSSTN